MSEPRLIILGPAEIVDLIESIDLSLREPLAQTTHASLRRSRKALAEALQPPENEDEPVL